MESIEKPIPKISGKCFARGCFAENPVAGVADEFVYKITDKWRYDDENIHEFPYSSYFLQNLEYSG